MIVAIYSDIHGNWVAYEQLLARLEQHGVARHFFLGDSCGYMPDAPPVVEALGRAGAVGVRGNHEAMLFGRTPSPQLEAVYRLAGTRERLAPSQLEYLGALPEALTVSLGSLRALMVHGSPWDPLDGYEYEDRIDARFDALDHNLVLMAHTHRPFVLRRPNGKMIANTGSVGLPRDVGSSGSYLLFDTETCTLTLHRFALDVAAMRAAYGARVHASVVECWARASRT